MPTSTSYRPTTFVPAQIIKLSQTPLPWTADPRRLFLADTILLLSKWTFLPGIFWPLKWPCKESHWDELYPSPPNIRSIVLHIITSTAQIIFLLALPFSVVLPTLWTLAIIAVFIVANGLAVRLLNGNKSRLEPDQWVLDVLAKRTNKPSEKEYWIYMNGVSVGRDWLQSNINRLSLTFNRKVHGVLNPTDGIVFDLLQCLVQRNLSFATNDIREAYSSIKQNVYDDNVTKVVFILHSQAGIMGSILVDWLLAEANHFNNPDRALPSSQKPLVSSKGPGHHVSPPKAIGHIEHYANEGDFVAQFGVLNFALANAQSRNLFAGRVFISPNSGHLLNQHYLHSMFRLDENNMCLENNKFMDSEIEIRKPGPDGSNENDDDREDAEASLTSEVQYMSDSRTPSMAKSLEASVNSVLPARRKLVKPKKQVKDFSRLWLYRNGRSPPEVQIQRAGTI